MVEKLRSILLSETSTEKQRTKVSRRTKIIIGVSAFILIFTFVVIWWFSTRPPFPATINP
jgi:O-antigen/teichoic acid export membrane protein